MFASYKKNYLFFSLIILSQSLFASNFYFKYISFTEGWWNVYVQWLNQGRIPYRDFELLTPPLYIYFLRLFDFFVDSSFFSLRLLGLFIQILISIFIFLIFKSKTPSVISFLTSLIVSFYLQSGVAFIPYDYVYLAILLSLISGYCVILFLKSNSYYLMFLSGFFLSLSFLIKQTFTVAFLVLFTIILLLSKEKARFKIKIFFLYFFGFSLPNVLLLLYLLINSAIPQYFNQIFLSASNVKGSTYQVLSKWFFDYISFYDGIITRIFSDLPWIFILIMLYSLLKIYENNYFFRFLTLFFTSLIFILYILNLEKMSNFITDLIYSRIFIYPLLFSFIVLLLNLNRKLSTNSVYSLVSIAFIWGCGMSAGLTEIGMFFSLGFLFVWTISNLKYFESTSILLLIILMSLFVNIVGSKISSPYSWWGYNVSKIDENQIKSLDGLTRNLSGSKSQILQMKKIKSDMKMGLKCSPKSVVFPHMPLFQLDTFSVPESWSANYWFDFSTEDGLKQDIELFENNLPGSVLIVDLPEFVWSGHENLFNNGNLLPQREFLNRLKILISSSKYQKIGTYDFSNSYVLKVYNLQC